MSSVEELYPTPCAFCRISSAYPHDGSNVPHSPDPERVDPQCHLILSTPLVLAFLDIMPISPGHILLTTRKHYRTLGDLRPASNTNETWLARKAAEEARDTSRALGEWLPIVSAALCRATGIEDWNVVQNNGERAAQVVPHIHFHLIPRYQEGRQETQRNGRTDWGALKSWKMFGRGSREDLDDDEARELAARLRGAIREEFEAGSKPSKL